MPSQVVHLKDIGNVTFSQNLRSKNIKVSVKADKSVLVSYPVYVAPKEVMAFVLKHKEWIGRQQQKMKARQVTVKPHSEIRTKLHVVRFIPSGTPSVKKSSNLIEVCFPDFNSDDAKKNIDDLLTEIYRKEARNLLPPRLVELAQKYGYAFNKVSIRNNRRNWGSCSSKNNISLNLQMMKLPWELIDYILLHELVHTRIKNHGPEFWKELNGLTQNRARELAREVKRYSTYTL